MNQQTENHFEIHPTVQRILRITGLALVCLAVYLSASVAITFSLGLFAGTHVVKLPGIGDPIVSLEMRQEKHRIAPGDIAEVARAEFTVTGDLMFHMPIVQQGWTGDGYDFHDIFQYVTPYLTGADLAAAPLETTFAGFDRGYSGTPWFNSPDEIAPTLKKAGLDILLTATEHAYDTDVSGLLRTLDVIRDAGLTPLGTVDGVDSPRWTVQTVGDLKIGMAAFTQATVGDDGSVSVGTLTADSAAAVFLSAFDPEHLSRFYMEVEGMLSSMESAGAEATVLFLHWGDDYTTVPSSQQRTIAQGLCDLGVDVIVGSHPHVVQPVDLLYSTMDPTHSTFVIYSAGTLLSNLRPDTTDVVSGHTEDGLLASFTISRYNDDSVRVSDVSLLPVWTAVYGSDENKTFCVLPLDTDQSDWALAYDLNDSQLSGAKSSYNRTMAIVTSGLNKVTHELTPQSVSGSSGSAPAETAPPATTEPLGVG